jgi:D-galacturonate reductase
MGTVAPSVTKRTPIFATRLLHHNLVPSLLPSTRGATIYTSNSNDKVIMTDPAAALPLLDVLMIGTGEYTTGCTGTTGSASQSDKGAGVVALTMLDLKKRGKINRIAMVGVNGTKFPAIRRHMQRCIGEVYKGLDPTVIETFPADDQIDPLAYQTAIDTFPPSSNCIAIVFTPDDTHFDITMACIRQKMHVLVTKPIVQTLKQHEQLQQAARQHNVLVAVEVHKRWDPFYADARDRILSWKDDFQYLSAYMSQPKHQLETFKAWAGKSSDISYYLNSHHVDWSEWTLHGKARPIRVVGTGSTGIAHGKNMPTEDSITLTVTWQNMASGSQGCAVYTASWVAPKSDVHSQQRFFFMSSSGEVLVDQAHRGCTISTDSAGFASVNPLFMKYTPNHEQEFAGQASYGYKSFDVFVDAARSIQAGLTQPSTYDNGGLATVHTTVQGTAILQAGRMSLDQDSRPMDIVYESKDRFVPVDIVAHEFS